jgi:hypothetical protein
MTGIPCSHAFFEILSDGRKPEDYVDDCCSLEMYNKAYDPIIYPMPREEQWLRTKHDKLEPP